MSVNKAILIGNVGSDPEVRYLDSGTATAKFSLATSESYNNRNGEKVTQTEWHNIVLWRGLAEVAEKYVKKGMQLYIEGRIRNRSYEDRNGNKKYITEIQGDVLQMLGKKGEYSANDAPVQPQSSPAAASPSPSAGNDLPPEPEGADDLPF